MKNQVLPMALCFLSQSFSVCGSDVLPLTPFDQGSVTSSPLNTVTADVTLPQLRATLVSPESVLRWDAAKELLKAKDDATILRLVYALKQGNAIAEGLLFENASINMVPYLLEDVAHGSFENYGGAEPRFARVRLAATEIVAKALAQTDRFPYETKEWLGTLSDNRGFEIKYVAEKSKFLIDWWTHNQDAIIAGKLSDATWLPVDRVLTSKTFDEGERANSARPPPPPPPPPPPINWSPLPFKVKESFKLWATRVSQSKQLDLTYVPLDFEVREKTTGSSTSNGIAPPNATGFERVALGDEDQKHRGTSMFANSIASNSDPQSWFAWGVVVVSSSGLLWLLLRRRG